jgi:hypothetical protein
MRIKILTTFIDKQATDPEKSEIAEGTEMTTTTERGAELVGLGLAIDLTPKAKPAPGADA